MWNRLRFIRFLQVSQIFQRHKSDANKQDFENKFNLTCHAQSTPKTTGILTKVFSTSGPNLVALARTGDELSYFNNVILHTGKMVSLDWSKPESPISVWRWCYDCLYLHKGISYTGEMKFSYFHIESGSRSKYRQVSNIRRTLVSNKIVAHSDVVGASPAGPNLVIVAWAGDKLSSGQTDDWQTHTQTDAGNDNTRRP